MGFVDDEGVVVIKHGVCLGFGKKHAVGHDLDKSMRARLVAESNLVAHGPADVLSHFLGNAMGDGDGGDSSRLGASDFSGNTSSCLQAHFGDLGAFPAPRLTGNNDDRVVLDETDDFLCPGGNGKSFHKRDRGFAA